jgi:hypothetical protein
MPQRKAMGQHINDVAAEAAAISVSGKTTLGGSAAGIAGWLASINWLGLSGVLIALAGLVVNVYFQMRRDRREAAESRERIASMRARCDL